MGEGRVGRVEEQRLDLDGQPITRRQLASRYAGRSEMELDLLWVMCERVQEDRVERDGRGERTERGEKRKHEEGERGRCEVSTSNEMRGKERRQQERKGDERNSEAGQAEEGTG